MLTAILSRLRRPRFGKSVEIILHHDFIVEIIFRSNMAQETTGQFVIIESNEEMNCSGIYKKAHEWETKNRPS